MAMVYLRAAQTIYHVLAVEVNIDHEVDVCGNDVLVDESIPEAERWLRWSQKVDALHRDHDSDSEMEILEFSIDHHQ